MFNSICTGKNSVVVGQNNKCTHDNCVLIGHGIESTVDYCLIVGNSKVEISRTMSEDEFNELRECLLLLVDKRS